ncbi:hypothetical protein MA16_Dca007224 [Dendrobium catenatum]|uniref:Uncharacterized protein n=1 Tax=Dendrobium catenatum TaxID=906689 RepID=A0A2I0W6D8_9ASPA|nr:hypothetical protein MA16_Dca007224 [Dendrobium catenatum]
MAAASALIPTSLFIIEKKSHFTNKPKLPFSPLAGCCSLILGLTLFFFKMFVL